MLTWTGLGVLVAAVAALRDAVAGVVAGHAVAAAAGELKAATTCQRYVNEIDLAVVNAKYLPCPATYCLILRRLHFSEQRKYNYEKLAELTALSTPMRGN